MCIRDSSNGPLPKALKNPALVPFFAFNTSSNFIVDEYSILMVIGGNDGKTNNRTVYISDDFGMTWNEGGQLIQLPDYMPALHSAQAFVFDFTTGARSQTVWHEFADRALPAGLTVAGPASRATEPITTWQTPYIFLYGGIADNGVYAKTIWRGTITRLKYKPIL